MAFGRSAIEGSPHHLLAQLVGGWAGTTQTWIDPDSPPTESKTQGSIQMILDGRFVLYLYQSAVDGEPEHGMFTFGYDTSQDRYEASWVDSYHNNTAIMFCTGQPTAKGFSVLGSRPSDDGGPDRGWRTEVEVLDREHLIITAYEIEPEGGETPAIKTALRRIK